MTTFTVVDNNVTEKLLHLCYNCEDAFRCDTEEKCLQCFTTNNLEPETETEDVELRELFRLYAW